MSVVYQHHINTNGSFVCVMGGSVRWVFIHSFSASSPMYDGFQRLSAQGLGSDMLHDTTARSVHFRYRA